MATDNEKEKSSDSHMEWAQCHDLALCGELLLINPFQAKYKTTARAKLWDRAAENLTKSARPAFKKSLDKRAVQECYRLLAEKFKERMAKERRESGASPTMSELDALVEELVEREHIEIDQRKNEDKSKSKKKEDGEEIRQKALEKLGETSKRKKEKEDRDGKVKKARKSSSETIEYLRERSEQEMKLKEKDLELEKSRQEEEKRKNDALFNLMLQPVAAATTTTTVDDDAEPTEPSDDENAGEDGKIKDFVNMATTSARMSWFLVPLIFNTLVFLSPNYSFPLLQSNNVIFWITNTNFHSPLEVSHVFDVSMNYIK